MRHLVISTHSVLADAFKQTAAMIAGVDSAAIIKTFSMNEDMDMQAFAEKIHEYLADKSEEDEFLILADLYGASPCNSSILGFRGKNYRVVTGCNLGIVLEALFAIQNGADLDAIAKQLVDTGKSGIQEVYLAG